MSICREVSKEKQGVFFLEEKKYRNSRDEKSEVNYKGDSQMEKGAGKARGRKDPEKAAKWGIGGVQLQRRHQECSKVPNAL